MSIPCVVPQSPRKLNPTARHPFARQMRSSEWPIIVERRW
jgi:hypothetical protein